MKKFIASLMIVLGGISFAHAQGEVAENPNAPKIEFEKTTINYGTIEKGADGHREFKFTNTGKRAFDPFQCSCKLRMYHT